MEKLVEYVVSNVAGVYHGAGQLTGYVRLYSEYVVANLVAFLHTRVDTVSNWTLVLVIFLVNTGLMWLCDRMHALYQARTQQCATVAASADEGFVECEEAALARSSLQPGDTTTTTVEVLERDATDGRYRFVPVTLSARFSRKLVAYKNSLWSLWRAAFVDRASEATVHRQLEAMQEELVGTAARTLTSGRQAGMSDSFLDMLQQTNAAQCKRFGSALSGLMAVKIKYAEKEQQSAEQSPAGDAQPLADGTAKSVEEPQQEQQEEEEKTEKKEEEKEEEEVVLSREHGNDVPAECECCKKSVDGCKETVAGAPKMCAASPLVDTGCTVAE